MTVWVYLAIFWQK